jgi:transcriptional regulator with XRE-family HTH domain
VARGLSVRALAREAGVAFSALHRIEAGKTSPRLVTLEAIAGALGVTVVELFAPATSRSPRRSGR